MGARYPGWQSNPCALPIPHFFRFFRYAFVHRTCTILSLSPKTNYTFAHHGSAHVLGTTKCHVGLCFLLRVLAKLPQACVWVLLLCSVHRGSKQDNASLSQRDHNSANQDSRLLGDAVVRLEYSNGLGIESLGCTELSSAHPSFMEWGGGVAGVFLT